MYTVGHVQLFGQKPSRYLSGSESFAGKNAGLAGKYYITFTVKDAPRICSYNNNLKQITIQIPGFFVVINAAPKR